jgi:hypothetical protein
VKLWRRWKKLPRTATMREQMVTMNLSDPQSGRALELSLPDASGEAFKRTFETRRWSPEFAELAASAAGIMLFVHPNGLVPPQEIDQDVEAKVEALRANGEGGESGGLTAAESSSGLQAERETRASTSAEGNPGNPKKPSRPEWNVRLASDQAKLVDLIQLLLSASRSRESRLAIIISAWDLLAKDFPSPSDWLQKQAPLLTQYLASQSGTHKNKIYGISAQGAALEAPGELINAIRASDRITVATDTETNADITAPIRWLLL